MTTNDNPFAALEELIQRDCHDQKSHIFLHPFDYGSSHVSLGKRNYTEDEVHALKERDFETRIFITNKAFDGSSVWLRTHFSDNHVYHSKLNAVRDYFKATHHKSFTAAKSALSELLTMSVDMPKSSYYSFAVTMASALSEMGKNTSFETDESFVENKDDIELARMKLCLLMHLVFSKMKKSTFLQDDDGSNIFRLIHCRTSVEKKDKHFLLLPWFSFLLQCCLTGYVIFQNVNDGISFSPSYIPLAIITFVYSSVVAYPGITEIPKAFEVYNRRVGPIQMIDFIVNGILPHVLLISGFLVSDILL